MMKLSKLEKLLIGGAIALTMTLGIGYGIKRYRINYAKTTLMDPAKLDEETKKYLKEVDEKNAFSRKAGGITSRLGLGSVGSQQVYTSESYFSGNLASRLDDETLKIIAEVYIQRANSGKDSDSHIASSIIYRIRGNEDRYFKNIIENERDGIIKVTALRKVQDVGYLQNIVREEYKSGKTFCTSVILNRLDKVITDGFEPELIDALARDSTDPKIRVCAILLTSNRDILESYASLPLPKNAPGVKLLPEEENNFRYKFLAEQRLKKLDRK